MNPSRVRGFWCFLLSLLFLVGSLGNAAAKTPMAILKEKKKVVIKLLDEHKAAKTKAAKRAVEKKFEVLLKPLLNMRRIGIAALKSQWGKLNKAQRDEYLFWLEGLIKESYKNSMKNNRINKGLNKGEGKLRFVRQTVKGRRAKVFTEIRYRKNRRRRWKRVRVDWVFEKNKAGKWLVADMLTNDNSLVDTYNEQFTKIIEKKSFKGLLKLLRKKVNQLRKKKSLPPLKYVASSTAAPKTGKRCRKGRVWRCVRRCLRRKRVRGRRRCVRYSKKKRCRCVRKR
jgi:phospholipid transport system substrate-binding protein